MAYSSRYRLSFSTGGLFVQESVGAARLVLGGCDWDETEKLLVARQIVSYNAISSGKRVAREIVTRLKSLSSEEIEFLVNADREDQICVVWQSICRTYEIIADFVAEDLEERLRSFRNDLAAVDFGILKSPISTNQPVRNYGRSFSACLERPTSSVRRVDSNPRT